MGRQGHYAMRQYFTRGRPASNDLEWWEIPNLDSTTRTVIETFEEYETGMLDAFGNKIMAREKKEPIGFVRFR